MSYGRIKTSHYSQWQVTRPSKAKAYSRKCISTKEQLKPTFVVAMYWQNHDRDVNTSITSSSTEDEWTMITLVQRYSNGGTSSMTNDHVPNSSDKQTCRHKATVRRRWDVEQNSRSRCQTGRDDERRQSATTSSRNNPRTQRKLAH